MNIFEIINEVAVLGTTLLMMAVATIWYSEGLFGKITLRGASIQDETINKKRSKALQTLVLTFAGYFVVLAILAYLLALSPLLSVGPLAVALLSAAFALAVGALLALSEEKQLSYYLVNGGFIAVLIIGGTFVLYYWPW